MFKKLLIVIFFSLLLTSSKAFSQPIQCSTPPPSQALDQAFYTDLSQSVSKREVRIAIFPFYDGTQISKDETLQNGFAIAIYDFLRYISNIGVYHPFVVFNVMKQHSLTAENYFSEDSIIPIAKQINATHAVIGMFQNLPENRIRYFIKIVDVQSGKRVGKVLEYLTEKTDRFFSVTSDATRDVLQTLTGKKTKSSIFKSYLMSAPSFESFRYYIKGMQRSHSYNETNLNVAQVWFQKSYNLSYSFKEVYNEIARLHFMIALIQKQQGKDFSISLEKARQALANSSIQEGKDKNQQLNSIVRAHRWFNAHQYFSQGVNYLNSGHFEDAKRQLEKGVKLIPEDGLAHYYLSHVYSQLGDPKASEELGLAKGLNGCIQ